MFQLATVTILVY